jgi:EAL domain-containing protein (putative c-di-GMP-specific phosphodiesterase class I)
VALTFQAGSVSPPLVNSQDATAREQAGDWDTRLALVLGDAGLVRPAFQPIFDLERGRVCGFEALARFGVEPQSSPLAWLRAAAERGLEAPLEAVLLRAGLRSRAELPENCFLSVNVSPSLLTSDAVQSAFEQAGRLDAVVVELTEREPVSDYDSLAVALDRLRARGATVAVDDAGAGYASLQHITRLRPEFIKLDRELVADLDSDAAKLALVEAVGAFAARIDAWVVAEGIERHAELDAVRAIEVPLGQGFGLGRPRERIADGPLALDTRDPATQPSSRSGLGAILAHPLPLRGEAELALAEQRFAAEPTTEFLVVVGEHDRPLGLMRREKRVSDLDQVMLAPLRVMISEAPEEVARRAMTRPYGQRFDQLVACDERGRYLGLLTTDQLVHLLSKIIDEGSQR